MKPSGINDMTLRDAVEARMGQAQRLLSDLVAAVSLSGQEQAAMEIAERAFAEVSQVQRVAMSEAIRNDPDYSDPVGGLTYDGRWNLRAARAGFGGGRSLLLNTHLDTVPAAPGQDQPFVPTVRDGKLFGRGSCDAKGQAVTIWLAMAAMKDLGVQLGGSLIAHLVAEEENGGNGTLAMIRRGESADGCVVLEPTDLKVLSSIRGAVWFRIGLSGTAGHSGSAGATSSALKKAIRVVEILEGYHGRLLAASRGDTMFDVFANPMPLTIGTLHAGNWPATAPPAATLEGVLGLLPNKTAAEVMAEMTDAIRREGGETIANSFDVHFTYRHDASVCPKGHPLVAALSEAVGSTGREPVVAAMTASCDAWFYNNRLGIPTVVFGGGSLSTAHSATEHMPLSELATAAHAVAGLVLRWCGANE